MGNGAENTDSATAAPISSSVPNTRGSVFSLCRRSRSDRGYARYPPVPVLACPGHEPARPGCGGRRSR